MRKLPYRREVIRPRSNRRSPKGNLANLTLSQQELEHSASCPFWNFISIPPYWPCRLRHEVARPTSGSILWNQVPWACKGLEGDQKSNYLWENAVNPTYSCHPLTWRPYGISLSSIWYLLTAKAWFFKDMEYKQTILLLAYRIQCSTFSR